MPPEVLAESIDEKRFKSFQMADIYSFSLLLWEIVMHSELNPALSSTYKPPYYEWVGLDPSFDDMKKVVSIEKKRPSLAPFLGQFKTKADRLNDENKEGDVQVNSSEADKQLITGICELIENCWLEDASKRFDYLEIRKRFSIIINQDRISSKIVPDQRF